MVLVAVLVAVLTGVGVLVKTISVGDRFAREQPVAITTMNKIKHNPN
jgi:hypothetical protein